MFPDIGGLVRDTVNDRVDALVTRFGDTFESISSSLLSVLIWIEWLLLSVPPWVFIPSLVLSVYLASRSVFPSLMSGAGLYAIGSLGLWEQAMQTIAIILVSSCFTTIVGVPAGILMARSTRTRSVFTLILDLMQTTPSFVYLIPAAMLFGLGKVPAILATIIYSIPPLIRLTDLGIRTVDSRILEAAHSFGAKSFQILCKVEIPLAMPSIMQGINQSIMMALSMVVIASMIGARGIGETVLSGLQRNDLGEGFIGGIGIVVLAVIFDRISQAIGRRLHGQA